MEETLHQLGGILLRAVPTFIIVVLLHFYLKFVFFKPLQQVLRQRYEATEGARKLAETSLQEAAAKTARYEAAVRAAKAEIYQAQDKLHKELQEREAEAVTAARRSADAAVNSAKALLAQDVEATKATLAADSDALADRIAESILRRSAA